MRQHKITWWPLELINTALASFPGLPLPDISCHRRDKLRSQSGQGRHGHEVDTVLTLQVGSFGQGQQIGVFLCRDVTG